MVGNRVKLVFDIDDLADEWADIILKDVDYDLWKEEQADPTGVTEGIADYLIAFFDEAIATGTSNETTT